VNAVRRIVVALIVMIVGFVACIYFVGFTAWGRLNDVERIDYLGRIAAEAAPIITAIRGFETAEGMAPGSLNALVPAFLPAVPGEWKNERERIYEVRSDGTWYLQVYLERFIGDLDCDRFVFSSSGCAGGREVAGWCWYIQ
jgi:hypothetical protein